MSDAPSANAAVLVIDLQTGMFNGVLEPVIHDADRLTERTRAVLAWARGSGRPVAFVRHEGPAGDPLARGEPGWPVWPALGQADGEPTFEKTVGDAFSDPSLGDWIAARGAQEVILLGAQSEHCVAATTGKARWRGASRSSWSAMRTAPGPGTARPPRRSSTARTAPSPTPARRW